MSKQIGLKSVKVKQCVPLFKGEEKANAIELVYLEEVGNAIVSQIGLFHKGDVAFFIEPDYCIPRCSLFESYYAPNGDESRCKLGSNGRIKAIKFNLHTGNNIPVYSYGILLPENEVFQFLGKTVDDLVRMSEANSIPFDAIVSGLLDIKKYEELDIICGNVGNTKQFPRCMYKTDEVNINNLWNNITYPIRLIGSTKVDGSSITLYTYLDKFDNRISGICSRNFEKPLTVKMVSGKHYSLFECLLTHLTFGLYKPKGTLTYSELPSNDDFVRIGKSYLDTLIAYADEQNLNIALRGELNGVGFKGSGNKNNPDGKSQPNIKFYGADVYDGYSCDKCNDDMFQWYIDRLGFKRCDKLFHRNFRSKKEIIDRCEKEFMQAKRDDNKLLEGIVLKTEDSSWSAKYMNLEYDSKK